MWQASGIYFTRDTYILPNTECSIYGIGYFHVDSYHAQSKHTCESYGRNFPLTSGWVTLCSHTCCCVHTLLFCSFFRQGNQVAF